MKKKLTNKLSLKRETLSGLTKNEMNEIKGGTSVAGCGNTNVASCWCTVTCRVGSYCYCP